MTGHVAQLDEHGAPIVEVAGSSPAVVTTAQATGQARYDLMVEALDTTRRQIAQAGRQVGAEDQTEANKIAIRPLPPTDEMRQVRQLSDADRTRFYRHALSAVVLRFGGELHVSNTAVPAGTLFHKVERGNVVFWYEVEAMADDALSRAERRRRAKAERKHWGLR